MSAKAHIVRFLWVILFSFSANSYAAAKVVPMLWWAMAAAFLVVNVCAGITAIPVRRRRLRICSHGAECLTIFCASLLPSIVWHAVGFWGLAWPWETWLRSALVCTAAHAVLFWNGILCVYLTSVQLGIRYRVVGALCGGIPLVNVVVLGKLLHVVYAEIHVETDKILLNEQRREQQICKTRYPILFVHGLFFRDSALLNYWGRIPEELELNGARVYYGHHSSALPIAKSAQELAWQIRAITAQSGCEKVNIIAHSKGGLDCRYAILREGVAPMVASLTTVSTPHRGCVFAEYLLNKVPRALQDKVVKAYNTAAHKLGDPAPDFMAAVKDLTASTCRRTDEEWGVPEGIFCQSVGSVLKHAHGGRFPLNFSHPLVRYFDGPNDGLVAEESFRFGERYTLLQAKGKRGISHGDMIDLNRENIPDFDVREFYVQLVSDLKNRGL